MNTRVSFASSPASFGEFLEDLAALGVAQVSDGGRSYGLLKARTTIVGGSSQPAAAVYRLPPWRCSSLCLSRASLMKAGVTLGRSAWCPSGWSSGRLRLATLPELPGKHPQGWRIVRILQEPQGSSEDRDSLMARMAAFSATPKSVDEPL